MIKGDFGGAVVATLDYPEALPPLSAVVFRFQRPDGTTVDKPATITSATRKTASYTIEDDLLTQSGLWQWQPRLEVDGVVRATGYPPATFAVDCPLPEPT